MLNLKMNYTMTHIIKMSQYLSFHTENCTCVGIYIACLYLMNVPHSLRCRRYSHFLDMTKSIQIQLK